MKVSGVEGCGRLQKDLRGRRRARNEQWKGRERR